MRVRAALLIGLVAVQGQPPVVRAGVVVASPERAVVALAGRALPVGTAVTVVGIEQRQETWRASIAKQSPDSDVMAKHALDGPFYDVTVEPGSPPLPHLAVAILGRADITRAGGAVILRLGDSAKDVRVRSCASSEGLHLTLWAGTPLKSPRLWHAYYYLGYDVEPTCTPADYGDGR